jgi:hypothetical protein
MPNKKNRKAIPGYTLVPINGYYKARKIGISGERVKTDPAYANTRRYNAEFGHASKIGKLIREGFLKNHTPIGTAGRLTARLLEILNTDKENDFGSRDLLQADLSGLAGFHFDQSLPLNKCCNIPFLVKEYNDRKNIVVQVPPFVPVQAFQEICGATSFRIRFRLVRLDQVGGVIGSDSKSIQGVLVSKKELSACVYVFDAVIAAGEILLLGVSIEFYKMVNGNMINNAQSATTILYAKNRFK